MSTVQPFINYSLPYSRVNQKLLGKNIGEAWNNIQDFLKECTTAKINAPSSVELIGYTASKQENEDPVPALSLLNKAGETFGKGKTKPIGYLYPSNKPHPQKQTEWKLKSSQLDQVLDFIISCEPIPKYNLGPMELIISYDFEMKEIGTKKKLPHQQYPSSVLIWLSRSKAISPNLHFPFIQPDKDFRNYLNQLANYTPFKLDEKYLRMVRPSKTGKGNVFTKFK